MRRFIHSSVRAACCAAALVSLLSSGFAASAGSPDQLRGDKIAIVTSAIDSSGNAVTDLKPVDLLARIESTGATVAGVSHVGAPSQIIVLLDTSATSARTPQKMIWNTQCVTALADQLPPATNVMVLGYSDRIAELYSGKANSAAIDRAIKTVPRAGEAALLEILKYMGDTLAQQGGGNGTIMVVVSDGVDTVSRASTKDVIRAIGLAGVPVYSLVVMDPSWNSQNQSKLNARSKLSDISKATGGTSISVNPGEVKKVAGTIGTLLDARYLVELTGVTLKSNSESRLTLDAQRAGIELYHADHVYNR